jgi:hypothetical protein
VEWSGVCCCGGLKTGFSLFLSFCLHSYFEQYIVVYIDYGFIFKQYYVCFVDAEDFAGRLIAAARKSSRKRQLETPAKTATTTAAAKVVDDTSTSVATTTGNTKRSLDQTHCFLLVFLKKPS